ncbi:MAG: hypothetical protein AW07_04369 [Candidatus Accumulibacter sp. SK-11]|nr:MAG: hypothetical protein AW07_04369 [Candidatus Accumulibacter sp. SK-11]
MPATRRSKFGWSSSERRRQKSRFLRNSGMRSSLTSTPGKATGTTRILRAALRFSAARTSGACQLPSPLRPMKTTLVLSWSSASSSFSCHGSPGTSSQRSNHTCRLASSRRRSAICVTSSSSSLL